MGDLKPIRICFCKASLHDFERCEDGIGIRAIGNFNPEFKDEEIWIKSCGLHYKKQGECGYQIVLGHLPIAPIFYLDQLKTNIDESELIEDARPVRKAKSPALDTAEICHTAPNSRVTQGAEAAHIAEAATS